jgi:hypothetical protein
MLMRFDANTWIWGVPLTDNVTSLARTAAIWRPHAPAGDHLLQNGLAFLHCDAAGRVP